MKFANPQAWHLLWLLPLIAAGLHLFFQYRRRMMARFVEAHLIDELAEGFSLKRHRLKAALLMAAFVFMVAALSRPQWGFHILPVKRHGLDVMVVIDTSKSMLTKDVKPSRLERTKLAIKDLILKLDGSDHIGLIAFAGDAMLMCPLTYDYNGFLLSLEDLGTDAIPRGGTNMAAAIDASIQAYAGMADSDKAVVLVTDGEDQEGDALQAARRAKAKGLKIFTVGVGTREGDLVQVPDASGQPEFLKDSDGNVVKSHLNENLLQQIAYITGGAYVHSGAEEFGLDYLYERQLSKLKKHDNQEKMSKQYDERFQWPLTLAFLLLWAEALVLHRKKILFFGIGVLFCFSGQAHASVAGEVNKANNLYKEGKFDDSLKMYQDALGRQEQLPVVQYDLGTALYKKGDYDKAFGYLQQAAQDKNLKIRPKAEYNLGNVLFRKGAQQEYTNVDEAIKSMQEAMGHYDKTMAEDPKDQDAQYNEDFVKKEIERLKQKKQNQQQNQQQNKQQNKQDQQQNQQNQQNQQSQQNQQNQQDQQNQQNQQQAQKNQQNQQNQQDQQQQDQKNQADKQNPSGSKKQKEQQAQDQAQQGQKDLDRKQAEDLLEDYQDNEEPKKLLNYRQKKMDERPVLKDW